MEKAIYLGEDSSGYKAACEGGKDSIYFLEHLGKLVSLSWKYVQKNKRKRNTLEALIQKRVRVVTNILSFLTD